MYPTLKVSVLAFTASLLFSSVNYAQSTLTFEALQPAQSQSATISYMTPYVHNREVMEFFINRVQLPMTQVDSVFINLRDEYKVSALAEIIQSHPGTKIIIDQANSKHGVWLAPRRDNTESSQAVWVEGSDVKLDLGNGQSGYASDVTAYYIRQLELSQGTYRGFLAKFREAGDEQFCRGTFKKSERCQTTSRNH